MNSSRHERVKRLFLAACELDEDRAGAFLDQACADDPELRREVASLLRHHLSTTIIRGSSDAATPGKMGRPVPPINPKEIDAQELRGTAMHDRFERFPSGTVIAGRWRITGRLGRGGMGEVYRADDLKLDQTVALKFLLQGRADSEAWRKRLHEEVRLARKVTHPNVNRVYDIGEADGNVFLSMEFVDGEDLASLLRRVGRLSSEKGVQIARQLCAGMGAAHDRGVIHRDLKPANVMIDGEGRVRITDFGIAALATPSGRIPPLAGTPAFIAPELFDGDEPSARSDLYSLGMVLYESVTGKEPFEHEAGHRLDRTTPPVPPSAATPEIHPALERVILQCLEPDPRRRPASMHAVAAALPGGDPLAMAVAAGRTPSPGMVAAAGGNVGLRPRAAITCLGIALAGLLAVVLLADRTFFLPQAGLSKPSAVLADTAQQVIKTLGHRQLPRGNVRGFTIDRGYLEYMAADGHRAWESLPTARPPAIFFWYRQGDYRLHPPSPFGLSALARKLPAEPGMTTVHLDAKGRLLEFLAMPVASDVSAPADDEPDWSVAFALAGLDMGQYHPIDPVRPPPVFADHLEAWEGAYPEHPDIPLRIEGASLDGRVNYFNVVPPWDQKDPVNRPSALLSRTPPPAFVIRFVLYLAALIGGIVLARHNVRKGRGDRRGAGRLAGVVLVLGLLDWLVGERHVPVWTEEAAALYLWTAKAVLGAAATWICYIAMEPYVRRFWPRTIISWSRLLAGRFRDPLLGRDILVGGILGIGLVLVTQIDTLLPSWLGLPPAAPKLPVAGYDLGELLGLRYKLGTIISELLNAISLGLALLLLMLLGRVVVRVPWMAAIAFCVLLTSLLSLSAGYDASMPWLTNAVLVTGLVLVLSRVGLVAVVVGLFVRLLLATHPITADPAAWYAPAGGFAVAVVAALLMYGFFTSLAGFKGRSYPV